jgi:hypothetical protein
MPRAGLFVLAAAVVITLTGATAPLLAQTPTAANFAACNAHARASVEAGTAVPIPKDHARAEAARSTRAVAVITDPSDPQLAGMASEGLGDAAYHAGYRTCMRRSGF